MCKKLCIALFLVHGTKMLVRREGSQILPPIVEMKNFDMIKYDLTKMGSFFSYSSLCGLLDSGNLPKNIAANFVADRKEVLPDNGTSKKWVAIKIVLREKDFAAIANNGGKLVQMDSSEIKNIVRQVHDKKKEIKKCANEEVQFDLNAFLAKKEVPKYRIDDTHLKLFEAFLNICNCHPEDGNFYFNFFKIVLRYDYEIS